MERQVPASIGGYPVRGVQETGLLFTVFRSVDPASGSLVLIWVPFPGCQLSIEMRRELLEALKRLSLLEHPNLLRILDFGIEDQGVFWITPDLSGTPLAERIEDARSEQSAARVAGQVAEALAYLHEHKTPHGSLNPGNVWLDGAGKVYLLNYGLEKQLRQAADQLVPEGMAGFGPGDPVYMAPEQILRGENTQRADIYALGVLYFALLNGKAPLDGFPLCEAAVRQVTAPLGWPAHLRGRFSPASIRFIHRCVSKHPRDRFRGGKEALDVLEKLARGQRTRVAVSRDQMKGAPRATPWVLRGVLLGLIFGLTGWLAWVKSGPRAIPPLSATPTEVIRIVDASTPTPTGGFLTPALTQTRPSAGERTITALTPEVPASGQETEPPPLQTPSATSTRDHTVLVGTPLPGRPGQINAENIGLLEEVVRIGSGRFNQVAYSRDGESIALATSAGVYIFRGKTISAFLDPGDAATSVAWFNDGRLVVGLRGGGIQLWDWPKRERLYMPESLQNCASKECTQGRAVTHILIGEDQKRLIWASEDGDIWLWYYDPEKKPIKVGGHSSPILDMALSNQGNYLATCAKDDSANERVMVWDLQSRKKYGGVEYWPDTQVYAVAFSPDEGNLSLATGGDLGYIQRWNVDTGAVIGEKIRLKNRIWDLRYVDEDTLVAGLADGSVKVVTHISAVPATGRILPTPTTSAAWIESFGGDETFYSASMDHHPAQGNMDVSAVWNGVLDVGGMDVYADPFEKYSTVSFSPDGRLLLAGGRFTRSLVWNSVSNQITGDTARDRLSNSSGWMIPPGNPFSSDSKKVLLYYIGEMRLGKRVGSNTVRVGILSIHGADSLNIIGTLGEIREGRPAQFILDDRLVASLRYADETHDVPVLWDVATRYQTRLASSGKEYECIPVRSANNNLLLTIFSRFGILAEKGDNPAMSELNRQVCIRKEPAGWASPGSSHFVYYDAVKKRLVVKNLAQAADSWDAPVDSQVNAVAFSPTKDLLVAASEDGSLAVWAVETGKRLHVIENAHYGPILSVAFSADGLRVATGSADGTVRVWEVLAR